MISAPDPPPSLVVGGGVVKVPLPSQALVFLEMTPILCLLGALAPRHLISIQKTLTPLVTPRVLGAVCHEPGEKTKGLFVTHGLRYSLENHSSSVQIPKSG